MTPQEAYKLLKAADVFFDPDPEDDFPDCVINLNDVFGHAVADGEEVDEEELPELADLFERYGWCGIYYWVSQKRGGARSESAGVNRKIDFVAQEETLRVRP